MPIALSEDQRALAESVTAITARHASKAATRAEFEDLAAGTRPLAWRALVARHRRAARGVRGGDAPRRHRLVPSAFGALAQRLLRRQLSGLQPGAEASVLKVASAYEAASQRRVPPPNFPPL